MAALIGVMTYLYLNTRSFYDSSVSPSEDKQDGVIYGVLSGALITVFLGIKYCLGHFVDEAQLISYFNRGVQSSQGNIATALLNFNIALQLDPDNKEIEKEIDAIFNKNSKETIFQAIKQLYNQDDVIYLLSQMLQKDTYLHMKFERSNKPGNVGYNSYATIFSTKTDIKNEIKSYLSELVEVRRLSRILFLAKKAGGSNFANLPVEIITLFAARTAEKVSPEKAESIANNSFCCPHK